MERESFVFYRSFYEAIRELKDDIKLEVFTAITEYALYGKSPEALKPVARGMFTLIKPNLDVNISRYENGAKGGRKPKKQSPSLPVADAPVPSPLSPSAPSAPAFSSFENEVELLKSEQSWCESSCMQFHIPVDELHRRLDAFVTHCKVERPDDLHPSLKEARRHFTSWMRKVYPASVSPNANPATPDDYSFKGGFGGLD